MIPAEEIPGLPVANWVDEVEAAVDPVIFDVPPVQAGLVSEVLVVLLIDELDDWPPAIMYVRSMQNRVYGGGGGGGGAQGGVYSLHEL